MKPQDVLFVIVLLFLLLRKNSILFTRAAILIWIMAAILYNRWIFFTAQRFVMYGAVFICIAIILRIRRDYRIQ
jgi:hypothetical protein